MIARHLENALRAGARALQTGSRVLRGIADELEVRRAMVAAEAELPEDDGEDEEVPTPRSPVAPSTSLPPNGGVVLPSPSRATVEEAIERQARAARRQARAAN